MVMVVVDHFRADLEGFMATIAHWLTGPALGSLGFDSVPQLHSQLQPNDSILDYQHYITPR